MHQGIRWFEGEEDALEMTPKAVRIALARNEPDEGSGGGKERQAPFRRRWRGLTCRTSSCYYTDDEDEVGR